MDEITKICVKVVVLLLLLLNSGTHIDLDLLWGSSRDMRLIVRTLRLGPFLSLFFCYETMYLLSPRVLY